MGEVTSFLTRVGPGTTPPLNAGYHLTMNLDKWNELSTDLKLDFLEAARLAEVGYARDIVPRDETLAIEGLADEFGVEVLEMPQSEIDAWADVFPDVWGPLAADLDGQGLDGTRLVNRYIELTALSTEELESLYDAAWEEIMESVS
jgi:TRAP-type C4-dicarboxylate transport system substrate-binding protein